MSSIKDLLNPVLEERPPAREKRVRIAKDAPLFRPGLPREEVRYPPIETSDETLLEKHREFKLHPLGRIADFPRHIPYQSDKKTFQEKTGRDSFNVFQYTFKIPGADNEWTVMWDYNIGLVRTTHLFKCNGHSKTAPGKVLNANSGLREICHSITGGSLAAQGYWMPYEAAKAVAATFCWKIRYVLTPLFGEEFPDICIKPTNGSQPTLGQIIIKPDIVHRATQTAELYRSLELQKDRSPENIGKSTPPPDSENDSSISAPYPRGYAKLPRRSYADSICSARGSSSEPSYCNSPQSPRANTFTPVNVPRTSHPVQIAGAPSPEDFVENRRLVQEANQAQAQVQAQVRVTTRARFEGRRLVHEESELPGSTVGPLDVVDADKAIRSSSSSDGSFESDDSADMADDDTDKDYSEQADSNGSSRSGKNRVSFQVRGKKYSARSSKNEVGRERERGSVLGHFAHEVKAAHALLHLHMQEALADGESLKESVWSPTLGTPLTGYRKRRHASM